MAGSTFPHNIFMPEASDRIKISSSPSKLAQDISTVAQTANNALSVAQAKAIAKAEQLDAGNRTDWGTAVFDALTQSKEYTDVSFQASGPGGATDTQVDAAVDRAVLGGRVADGSVMARMPSDGKIAVGRGDYAVYAKDHGAAGDGITNDRYRIQEAITFANGKDVILDGGTTYNIIGSILMPVGADTVSLKASGPNPAILKLGGDGQSNSAIKFEQTVASASTTLTASIGHGKVGWPVASTVGIEPGMLCEVISTALWYFDPRDTARKSELHKVRRVEGNVVYFEDPANDGYEIPAETVTLTFYKPIKVRLENIKVMGTLPGISEETKAVIGLEINHADSPQLINVDVENCARTGIRMYACYRPQILGGQTTRANNYYNGYGVSIDGCAHAFVWNRFSYECRRHTDVTGQQMISRMSTIHTCTAVGGGKNSRGISYGWNDDGSIGNDQYGFGSHGPADQTRYIDCTTIEVSKPYMLRGRDEVIVNMNHIGRTYGGVIACSAGTNLDVQGGSAVGGYWSQKHSQTHRPSNPSPSTMRPDYLVRVYPGYQMNPPDGFEPGRININGPHAEVQSRVIWFDSGDIPRGRFKISGDFNFAPIVEADEASLMVLAGTEPVFSKKNWFVGPVTMVRDTGTGGMKLAHNITLTGANVLNYTVST